MTQKFNAIISAMLAILIMSSAVFAQSRDDLVEQANVEQVNIETNENQEEDSNENSELYKPVITVAPGTCIEPRDESGNPVRIRNAQYEYYTGCDVSLGVVIPEDIMVAWVYNNKVISKQSMANFSLTKNGLEEISVRLWNPVSNEVLGESKIVISVIQGFGSPFEEVAATQNNDLFSNANNVFAWIDENLTKFLTIGGMVGAALCFFEVIRC